jgi:hypothetical protein
MGTIYLVISYIEFQYIFKIYICKSNISNYIPWNTQNTTLCVLIGLQLNWSHLQLMAHKLLFFNENQIKCYSHGRMKPKIVTN